MRITWRLAIDRQRANRRRANRDQEHGSTGAVSTTVDPVLMNERAALVWQAIDALPDKLRLTIVLAGIEGHDVREVAQLLKLPEGTVKSRLFLARERMKESLKWTMEPSSMTDADLDREIQAALAVDPSPQFVARVRTEVANQPIAPKSSLGMGDRRRHVRSTVAIVMTMPNRSRT